jgi:peptidyl-prolyl cis-trans isomerase D
MLQNISDKLKNNKWLTYGVGAPLILVFAAWGAYGIVDAGFSTGDYAAKVNGDKISTAEINRSWQQKQPQYLRAFGGSLTEAQRLAAQQEVLDGAVRDLAANQHAHKVGYAVSDDMVKQAYQAEEAFQVDGKFNLQAARSRLLAAGMTEAQYEADQRRGLMTNHLVSSIGVTDFLTRNETQRLLALQDEQRELRFVLLQPDAFAAGPAVEPAAIEAYYKDHAKDFARPESVKLAYAELALADVAAQIQITEQQLHDRYEKDKASFVEPERRRARHILITVDDKTPDAQAAATAKQIYDKLKGGADFAALAKSSSKDSASAEQGGDLGWAARDAYVQPFADALFAMKDGELSQPVKTQFGYHIIRLDGIRAAGGKTFDDARAELAAKMRTELAGEQFNSREDQLQERIERGGTTLAQLAQEFALQTGVIDHFEKGAGGLPLGSDAELNALVFSDASVNQRRVGGPFQLGEERLAVFQVQDHQPPQARPLDEVRAAIVTTLSRERGTKAAVAAGEAALARLNAGEPFDKVAASLKVKPEPAKFISRTEPSVPVQIRDAVFAANRPAAGKPVRRSLPIEGGAVALLEVTSTRVEPMGGDNLQLQQLRSQREQQTYSLRDIEAYLDEVMKNAKVSKNLKVFE